MLLLSAAVVGGGLVLLLERMRRRNEEGIGLLRAGIGVVLGSVLLLGAVRAYFTSSLDPGLRPEQRPRFEAAPWLVLCASTAAVGTGVAWSGFRRWRRPVRTRPR